MVIRPNFRLKYILYPAAILLALCLEQLRINTTYSQVYKIQIISSLVYLCTLSLHPLYSNASVHLLCVERHLCSCAGQVQQRTVKTRQQQASTKLIKVKEHEANKVM